VRGLRHPRVSEAYMMKECLFINIEKTENINLEHRESVGSCLVIVIEHFWFLMNSALL
jgi:hypothetical protein